MFCFTKLDIFTDSKCDIAASQLRYDINPLTPRRAYRVQSTYRTALRYIANPNGIYIAANKKLPPDWVAVSLLAISP